MTRSTAKAAPTAEQSVTVTDNSTGKSFDLPIMDGTLGPQVIDVRKLYTDHGFFTYDPGFTSTGSCEIQDHLHRRRAGHPAPSRLSDSGVGRAQRLHGSLLPAAGRRTADRRAEKEIRARHHPSHDAARAAAQRISRLPPRRPSHGRHHRRRRRDVRVLSRQHRYRRSASAHDRLAPADREDADRHRLRLQVLRRPALHLSAQQVQLLRKFPAT